MRVLIVDDNALNRKLLHVALVSGKHEVAEAADGVEALEKLRSGEFDAVIADILMPRMDGYRFCHEVRRSEDLAGVPLIVYSSTYTSDADERTALSVGADRFIRKPATAEVILRSLAEIVGSRSRRPKSQPLAPELEAVKEYSEGLVRMLEQKNVELESAHGRLAAANEELRADVVERKRAEEGLRKSERRFALAFNASPVPTIISEVASGHILDVNEQFVSTLGYAREELIGRTTLELGLWNDPRDRVRISQRIEREGAALFEEVQLRTRSGEIRSVVGSIVQIHVGSLQSALSTFIDITERKTAEETLARKERHFRSLIENAQDLITIIDLEGSIHFQSPSAERILGRSPGEFVGKSAFEFLHPDDAPLAQAAIRHAVESPESPQTWLLRFRHANGSWRTMEGIGKLLPGEGSPQIVVNSRDVTESRAVEAQLRQSQKMDAVGRLAGGIAHDFNNVLTVILGYAELAATRAATNDALAGDLNEIRKAAERAGALTRQLLAFSRKQVLQPRVVDLNGVIRNMEGMLRRLIGENIDLVVALPARLGLVKADTGQIEQVLLNLVVNARDAMPNGGKLIIGTGDLELDAASASRFEAPAGPYVVLAVMDTGVGMDAATVGHIFEPFFTTKEAGKGTGLGLSTVYGIVRQSGGHVAVASEPGLGTTFKVCLPRIRETPEIGAVFVP